MLERDWVLAVGNRAVLAFASKDVRASCLSMDVCQPLGVG